MDAPDRGNAIGRGGQLRSDLGICRCPTLQRKQAYDYLYAVQQSMIGLPAQERLLLDQPVLLTKQSLILGESLSQPAFRAPMSYQLAFITRDRAALATVKNNMRKRIRAGRRIFNGDLSCFPVSRLRFLDTRT